MIAAPDARAPCFIALTLMAGCALLASELARSGKSADEPMVAQCEYLDTVTGWSGWDALAQDAGTVAAIGARKGIWSRER